MLKVYVAALCAGVVVLLVWIFAGSLRDAKGKGETSRRGRSSLGGLLGFAMGGIAAEYSPLDFVWPVSLILAVVGAAAGALWVGYATRGEASGGDHP